MNEKLCRICKVGKVAPGKIRKRDYICSGCNHRQKRPETKAAILIRRRNGRPIKERISRKGIRDKIFDHYGRICVYCGATNNLQLDHTFGDGKRERRTQRTWFHRIVTSGFPRDCQVVCRQCNIAKQQMTDQQFRDWIMEMAMKIRSRSLIQISA